VKKAHATRWQDMFCGLIGAEVRPDWTPMTGAGGMGGAYRVWSKY
jgi:hypothetical protein